HHLVVAGVFLEMPFRHVKEMLVIDRPLRAELLLRKHLHKPLAHPSQSPTRHAENMRQQRIVEYLELRDFRLTRVLEAFVKRRALLRIEPVILVREEPPASLPALRVPSHQSIQHEPRLRLPVAGEPRDKFPEEMDNTV